jgi:serine/threonine protein phosphatase 1
MLKFLRRQTKPVDLPPTSIGADRRVYAIGDIHGRADLLGQLLALIAQDHLARPPLPLHIVLLGDLIDRGPESAQVIDHAMSLAGAGDHVHFLKGNHEEVFVSAARGSARAARFFRRFGGMEPHASYGLPMKVSAQMSDEALAEWMLNHVPRAHVDFVDGFADRLEMGDYLFVHAGIRPGVALDEQTPADMRWIRAEVLSHNLPLERMIVHGHSISEDVEELPHRIGIDTGAYYSGRLTAIGLEGTDRWFLQTGDQQLS